MTKEEIAAKAAKNYCISKVKMKIAQNEAAIDRLSNQFLEQNLNLIRMYEKTLEELKASIKDIKNGHLGRKDPAMPVLYNLNISTGYLRAICGVHDMHISKSRTKYDYASIISYLRRELEMTADKEMLDKLTYCGVFSEDKDGNYSMTNFGEKILVAYDCFD